MTATRAALLARADFRCECNGECGAAHGARCWIEHGTMIHRHLNTPARWMPHAEYKARIDSDDVTLGDLDELDLWRAAPVKVVLTRARRDRELPLTEASNVVMACARCRLAIERKGFRMARHRRVMGRMAIGDLPGLERP